MPHLVFIDPNDAEVNAPYSPGDTLLHAAQQAGVDGILAECGGGCSCATCHVILNPAWDNQVQSPSPQEADMLTFAVDPTPYSRLACQMVLSDAHDGLHVHVAKRQY